MLVPRAYAGTYYVSTTGNNANDGSQATPWRDIQFAINSAASGDVVMVLPGTYSEFDSIGKPLSLIGVSNGAGVKPVLNGSATPPGAAAGYVLAVGAPNVTISNFTINVDQVFQYYGIKAINGGFDNLTITDCYILSGANISPNNLMTFDSWGIYAQTLGSDRVTIKRNHIMPKILNTSQAFGRAIRLLGPTGFIGGTDPADSNVTLAYYGVQYGDPGGAFIIQNNKFYGYGVELFGTAAGQPGLIADNKFDTYSPQYIAAELEIKDVRANSGLTVTRNTFSGYGIFGLMVERSANVTIDGNIFTPKDTAKNFASIILTSKLGTGGTQQSAGSVSNVAITNNRFNGTTVPSPNGYGIVFANYNYSASVTPFINVTVGGAAAGQVNTFDSDLAQWIALDTSNGVSVAQPVFAEYPSTPTHPVRYNLDASGNLFEIGGSFKAPSELTTAELALLEDRIQHAGDADSLGFVTVVPGNAYVTTNSFFATRNTIGGSLQRALTSVPAGTNIHTWVPNFAAISVTKDFTLTGEVPVSTGNLVSTSGKTLTLGSALSVTNLINLASGRISIGNFDLSLASGANLNNANTNGYIVTNGSGRFVRQGIGTNPLLFPVGTSTGYSPVTFTDAPAGGPTGDDIGVKVKDAATTADFSAPLPALVTKYVSKEWDITEATPGGNNATLTFEWPSASEVNPPLSAGTIIGHFNGTDWEQSTAVYSANTATGSGFTSFSPFAVWALQLTAGNKYYVSPSTGLDSRANTAAINRSTPWRTIATGISKSLPGDTLVLMDGTHTGGVTVNKGLVIMADPLATAMPIVVGPTTGTNQAVFTVAAKKVTIKGLEIDVNQAATQYGVRATSTGLTFDSLVFRNNRVLATLNDPNPGYTTMFTSMGMLLDGNNGTDYVTIQGNYFGQKVPGVGTGTSQTLGRAIRMLVGHGFIGGPDSATQGNYMYTEYGVQAGSLRGGPIHLQGNTTFGIGYEMAGPVANSGTHLIEDNTFYTYGPGVLCGVEIKAIAASRTGVEVRNNRFMGFSQYGVLVGRSNNVNIKNNVFRPSTTAANTTVDCIHINTKQETTGAGQTAITDTNITVIGNKMFGNTSGTSRGLVFANHNGAANVVPFKKVWVGGLSDSANTFDKNLKVYIALDTAFGNSKKLPLWNQTNYAITTMFPTKFRFNASGNLFATATGASKRPAAMTLPELFKLENKIQHQSDFDSLGFVTVVPNTVFVGDSSFIRRRTSAPGLRGAFAAALDNWTIKTAGNNYSDAAIDTTTVTLDYTGGSALSIGSLTLNGAGKTLTLADKTTINGALNLTKGFVSIRNYNLTANGGITGGNTGSYVVADAAGKLVIPNVGNAPVTFPIGSTSDYAPVTFDDANSTGDAISANVFSTNSPSDFDPPLPAEVVKFVNLQWNVTEAVPGGSNATLSFGFSPTNEFGGSVATNTLIAKSDGEEWTGFDATYTAGSTATSNLPFASFGDFAVYTLDIPHGVVYYVDSISGDDSRSPALARISTTPWKTIKHGIATTFSYDTLDLLRGTFEAGDIISNGITIRGNKGASALLNVSMSDSATPVFIHAKVGGTVDYLYQVDTANVNFENLTLVVDMRTVTHGIKSLVANTHNNLKVSYCNILSDGPYTPAAPFTFATYGIRLEGSGTDVYTIKGNRFTTTAANRNVFGQAFRAYGGSGLIGGTHTADSNLFAAWLGIHISGAKGGPVRVTNNHLYVNGLQMIAPPVSRTPSRIRKNRFDVFAAAKAYVPAALEIRGNESDAAVEVDSNTFMNYSVGGILSGRNANLKITNNEFWPFDSTAPLNTAFQYKSISIDSKQHTRAIDLAKPGLQFYGEITGNKFHGSSAMSGRGISFDNNDARSGFESFAPDGVKIGGEGDSANTFDANLTTYIANDYATGISSENPIYGSADGTPNTLQAPATARADVSNNLYPFGAATKRGTTLTLSEQYAVEDRILHGIDYPGAGFFEIAKNTAFVTANSFVTPITSAPSLTRADMVIGDDDTIKTAVTTLTEVSRFTHTSTLWAASDLHLGGIAMNGAGKTLTPAVKVFAADSVRLDLSGGYIKLANHNLVASASAIIAGGSQASYVMTDSVSAFAKKGVTAAPVTFPIGTAADYAPVTFDDNNSTGDSITAYVVPRATATDFVPDLPAGIKTFVGLEWDLSEGTPGGSLADLTFGWNAADVFQNSPSEPLDNFTRVAHYINGAWERKDAVLGANTATATGYTSFSPFAVYRDTATVNITISLPGTTVCAGSTVTSTVTVEGTVPGPNTFTVQLSNASGSFAAPVNIGSANTNASGTIDVTIPAGTTPGTGYMVRVITSGTPVFTGTLATTITVVAPPTAPVITNLTAGANCSGTAAFVASPAGAPGDTLIWSNGFKGDTLRPATAGSYTVFRKNASGCSSAVSAAVVVTATPAKPTITANRTTGVCGGTSFTLHAAATGNATFTFLGPNTSGAAQTADSLVVTADSAGGVLRYAVKVTSAGGCTSVSSDSVTITVNPQPATPAINATPATSGCAGTVITLTGPAGFSNYAFSGQPVGTNSSVNITLAGAAGSTRNFRLAVQNANGCWSDSSTLVTLTTSGSPTAPTFTVNGYTASPAQVCYSSTFNIRITGAPVAGNTYQLYIDGVANGPTDPTGNFVQTAPDPTPPPPPVTYEIRAISGTCTSAVGTAFSVVYNVPVTAVLNVQTSICLGDTIRASSTNTGTLYSFNGGAFTAASSFKFAPTAAGTEMIRLQVVNGACTSAVDTNYVTVQPPTSGITLVASSATVCQGTDSVTFTAAGGGAGVTYTFSGAAGFGRGDTYKVSAATAGTFTVGVVANVPGQCASTLVNSTFTVKPSGASLGLTRFSGVVCEGQAINVTATAGDSLYTFSLNGTAQPAQTSNVFTIANPTAGQNYTVTLASSRDTGKCAAAGAADTAMYFVRKASPAGVLSQAVTSVCLGADVVFTAELQDSTYIFNVNGVDSAATRNNVLTLANLPAGTYTVYVRTALNSSCGYGDTSRHLSITVNPAIAAPAAPTVAASTICQFAADTVTATGTFDSFIFTVNGVASASQTSGSFGLTTSGTDSLIVSVQGVVGACTSAASGSVVVHINPAPSAVVTASPALITCGDQPVTLSAPAGNGFTYIWKKDNVATGTTASTLTATTSGVYTVDVISAQGCTTTSALQTVSVNSTPVISLVSKSDSMAANQSDGKVEVSVAPASPDYEYTYRYLSDSVVSSSPAYAFTATLTAPVRVTVRNKVSGCTSAEFTTVIRVNQNVFIPSAFAPEGTSDVNRTFKVHGYSIDELHLRVYDRNGVLVYESDNVQDITTKGWDGTSDGKLAPSGTYFYNITGLRNGKKVVDANNNNSGTINLIR
ncbi:MAG: right-handed parallel beta-helix repeat-containing protein [Bacteroidota bacterium]